MAPTRIPSEGWVEHDGGPMPVAGDTLVQIQLRLDRDRLAAERLSGPQGNTADAYETWVHDGSGADIIAFRRVAA